MRLDILDNYLEVIMNIGLHLTSDVQQAIIAHRSLVEESFQSMMSKYEQELTPLKAFSAGLE